MKNTYSYSLKNFKSPNLKKDGTSYKWGSIIPLAGGESLGCSLATQNKPAFLLSYSAFAENDNNLCQYWPDVPYFNLDETKLDDLKPYFENVDFINAVPPCAGLSSLNTCNNKESSMARGSDAIQNNWLYKTSIFVLENIKPKVLFGENAPALFTESGRGVADNLAEIAKEYGYSFSMMKTNSLLHGLPQNRERTFYFFWNSKSAPFMNYHKVDRPTHFVEFLEHLPKGLVHENDFAKTDIYDSFPTYKWLLEKVEKITHKEFVAKNAHTTLHRYLYTNNLLDEALKYLEKNYPEHNEIRLINWINKKISENKGWWDASPQFYYTHFNAVVSRNMWCGAHPTEERFLSVREMLWLMGHPWDYNLALNKNGNFSINHLAQNVPVITARDQAIEVMKFINDELIFSSETYLRQNNHKPIVVPVSKSLF